MGSVRAKLPASAHDIWQEGGLTALSRLWQSTTECSPMPTVAAEGAAHIVRYVNPAFCRLAGQAGDDLIGRPFAEAVPEGEDNGCIALLDEVYSTRQPEILEGQLHAQPAAQPVYWSYAAWAVPVTERCPAIVMVQVTNTTETVLFRRHVTRMNEELLVSSVRQHEMTEIADLLNARLNRSIQESHHRIKNNLHVVSTLVELQIGESGSTASDEQLGRINQHIRVLASIHDMLTIQAKDNHEAEYVSAQAMLGRLIPMLQETSGGRRIEAEIAGVVLPMQKAVSLSLVISECISNAVKHAKGRIEVTLCAEGEQARLEVSDDGSGFPHGFDAAKAAHTGLSLIDSTTRHDLRGEVRFDNHARGGGRVTITFPVPPI